MGEWDVTLPADKRPLYIRWFLTTFCNYRCDYCPQDHSRSARYTNKHLADVFRRGSGLSEYLKYRGRSRAHAFDNFPPSRWIRAFEALSDKETAITISGGEPFLDRRNFRDLLAGLTSLNHVQWIRIDTNGTWSPKQFQGVDWKKIFLNVSYHPAMVRLERFTESVKEKLDEGIQVTMVNYVMAPTQLDDFLVIQEKMDALGVFVNANVYCGDLPQSPRGHELYRKFIPEIDIALKTSMLATSGKPCSYPGLTYELDPTGMANVGCFPSHKGDFIRNRQPQRPGGSVPCPKTHCTCLDMYAFLGIVGRARKFNVFEEYVDACKRHREGIRDSSLCS